MDYIISEDRLVRLVDKYITSVVGELTKRDSSHVIATTGDLDFVDENENIVFQFIDGHLGVSQNLFVTIGEIFNRNFSETEDLILRWFKKKYPDEPVQAVYVSIYY